MYTFQETKHNTFFLIKDSVTDPTIVQLETWIYWLPKFNLVHLQTLSCYLVFW